MKKTLIRNENSLKLTEKPVKSYNKKKLHIKFKKKLKNIAKLDYLY